MGVRKTHDPEVVCAECGKRTKFSQQTIYQSRAFFAKRRFCSKPCHGKHRQRPMRDRFEELVVRGPGCWGWKGGQDGNGYARLFDKKKTVRGHRLSYELHYGPVPVGMVVRHACDNPICSNPDHLMIGTPKQNSDDMVERGRQAKGEKHPGAKLTVTAVVDIRTSALSSKDLSAKYNVAPSAISKARRGLSWKASA